MNRTAWLLLFVCIAASAAPKAPIYRCGPDGRVFSQAPCPGGEIVESSDPRTAAQREQARRAAAQERQTGAELERQRRADEAAAQAKGPAGMNAQPLAAEAAASAGDRGTKARRRAQPATAEKDFIAVEPGARSKRR